MTTLDESATYRRIEDLLPAEWNSTYEETRDGTRLHYYQTGDPTKQAIVLLHGYMPAGITWLRTAQALQDDFNLILLDMRGHGYSEGVENGFSLDILADDLADVVNRLELENPVVLGHSMGAEIAARFGAAYPDVPRGIVLVEPPMRNFNAGMFRQTEWYQGWLAQIKALKIQAHEERMISGKAFLPPGMALPQEADYVTHVEATALYNLDVLDHSEDMDYRTATPELISKVTAPILLLTGEPERGGVALPEGITAMQGAWQNGQHQQINGAGHFIHYDNLDALVDAIRAFTDKD